MLSKPFFQHENQKCKLTKMSTSLHAFTKNPLLKMIFERTPKGLKRLVFLSSLIAYVVNTNKPEKAFISNMNKVLHLSRGGDSSLELPVRLSRVFWGDRELFLEDIKVLTDSNSDIKLKHAAAEDIASKVPSWFCYNTIENIGYDIVRYFTYSPSLMH